MLPRFIDYHVVFDGIIMARYRYALRRLMLPRATQRSFAAMPLPVHRRAVSPPCCHRHCLLTCFRQRHDAARHAVTSPVAAALIFTLLPRWRYLRHMTLQRGYAQRYEVRYDDICAMERAIERYTRGDDIT